MLTLPSRPVVPVRLDSRHGSQILETRRGAGGTKPGPTKTYSANLVVSRLTVSRLAESSSLSSEEPYKPDRSSSRRPSLRSPRKFSVPRQSDNRLRSYVASSAGTLSPSSDCQLRKSFSPNTMNDVHRSSGLGPSLSTSLSFISIKRKILCARTFFRETFMFHDFWEKQENRA